MGTVYINLHSSFLPVTLANYENRLAAELLIPILLCLQLHCPHLSASKAFLGKAMGTSMSKSYAKLGAATNMTLRQNVHVPYGKTSPLCLLIS